MTNLTNLEFLRSSCPGFKKICKNLFNLAPVDSKQLSIVDQLLNEDHPLSNNVAVVVLQRQIQPSTITFKQLYTYFDQKQETESHNLCTKIYKTFI